ncbi:hypothetical protein [Hymenobacter sediminicola]|uniref:Uncharacterized protein n=1 Tax=Hymenobacter sediminicola TaxID=2761579 RepID=A0A7G7WBD4_9BACT|nr:hypothetical protein [Hymenobacter sediminicola]QNH63677.1 hypothetical protein H4317_07740 [Hymenobacter sediminicola]
MCSNQLSYCPAAGGPRPHDPINLNEVGLRYGTGQVKKVRGNRRQASYILLYLTELRPLP